MKKWFDWFLENWQISILTFISIGVSLYSLVVSIFDPNLALGTDRKIDLILLLLSAYVLNVAKRNKENKLLSERLLILQESLSSQHSIPYCLSPIVSRVLGLEQEILNKEITFRNHHEVMYGLLKMMDSSLKSYQGLNFYGQGWKGGLNEFYDANIWAVSRGLHMTRYFIWPFSVRIFTATLIGL